MVEQAKLSFQWSVFMTRRAASSKRGRTTETHHRGHANERVLDGSTPGIRLRGPDIPVDTTFTIRAATRLRVHNQNDRQDRIAPRKAA
jgi:hypothetical protein